MAHLAQLTVESRDGLVVVGIRGEIDLSNVRDINRQIVEATPSSAQGLVVDLSAVTYLDSAGVNCLFDLNERPQLRRQRFCIVVAHGSLIDRIVEFSNLSDVASISRHLDDALSGRTESSASRRS